MYGMQSMCSLLPNGFDYGDKGEGKENTDKLEVAGKKNADKLEVAGKKNTSNLSVVIKSTTVLLG